VYRDRDRDRWDRHHRSCLQVGPAAVCD
jgi:hypothetical protein